MEITEVRIKLMDEGNRNGNERLRAFCSITFDNAFVVRDLKIIEGTKGSFVAMPSRRLTDRCICGCKNHLRSRHCSNCGRQLDENRATRDADGRAKLHADIAHPINGACREMIQAAVLNEYQSEKDRAQQPGYVSRYDESEYDGEDASYSSVISRLDGPAKNKEPAPHSRPEQTPTSHASESETPSEDPKRSFGTGIL